MKSLTHLTDDELERYLNKCADHYEATLLGVRDYALCLRERRRRQEATSDTSDTTHDTTRSNG